MDYLQYVSDIKSVNPIVEQTGGQEIADKKNDVEKEIMASHNFPSPTNSDLQKNIYEKRDFHIYKIPAREEIKDSDRLEQYKKVCQVYSGASPTQSLISNIINPNTPYSGLLLYHGTGAGKSGASIMSAEKFKPMVDRYGTKIHVLVPGPLTKQNYIGEILKFTGDTYKGELKNNAIMTEAEKENERKIAINNISQYYKIMSHRSFQKKVTGEKINDKIIVGDKVKITQRKDENGEPVRDMSMDRIYRLDNTLLIVDEAHHLTANGYGDAVMKIKEESKNLKILLLTATPMKNLADDFIDLINFLRPLDSQISRSKIFTSDRGHGMVFKPTGEKYIRKMVRGYISYLRGADPLTFSERIDVGVIPQGLDFTKLIRCRMDGFQQSRYDSVMEQKDDSLAHKSIAVSNFAFPGLTRGGGEITGYQGGSGISEVKRQLKTRGNKLREVISNTILSDEKIVDNSNIIYLRNNDKTITGEIFSEKYLRNFSAKFYEALMNLNKMVHGQEGHGLSFVYSNLVDVGAKLFREVLRVNGYLEYQENSIGYSINDNTRCYYCDVRYGNHKNLPSDIPDHQYHPATFLTITGKAQESVEVEQIADDKFEFIRNVFNRPFNKNGKYIKIIIGSRVMTEGITLHNIRNIHILDMRFTLGSNDQVVGRGIRFCKHADIISEENLYPQVKIYKYAIALESGMSAEEELYKNAEEKYKLIKKTERIFQEEAIDCPINRNGNVFPEELKKYADCGSKTNPCPAICGYMSCNYLCSNKVLNAKYYDPSRNIYKNVPVDKLDYSTYNNSLAIEEINYSKRKIKELFRTKHIYGLDPIVDYVRNSYDISKRDMFDEFYVYKALDDFIPITANDFNNLRDILLDKFDVPGYLIYRSRFYIFQKFGSNENVPMHYRRNYSTNITNKMSIREYTKNYHKDVKIGSIDKGSNDNTMEYDFDSTLKYYESREENDYVTIVDGDGGKNIDSNKINDVHKIKDVHKIREKRPKFLKRKRQTGIPSFKGSVCATSKSREYLLDVLRKVGVTDDVYDSIKRETICDMIYNRMYDLEKYSTKKDGNKLTYLIVPFNHPNIPFPLNLEDRLKSIINDVSKKINRKLNLKIQTIPLKNNNNNKFSDIKYVKYIVKISDMAVDNFGKVLEEYGGEKKGSEWIITIE